MSALGFREHPASKPQKIGLSASLPNKPRGVEKRIATLRRHWTPTGERLLEIGCGNADYAIALSKSFEATIACDVQFAELPVAMARGISAMQMSATQMGVPSNTFDFVLAIEVLEHVESVEDVVRELHRVLKPGGIFYFTSPNRWFPFETHSVHIFGRQMSGKRLPLLPYFPRLHDRISEARNFTASELRSLLVRVGYREIATDYVMPPFDGWKHGRRFAAPVTDWLESSRLNMLGVSVAGIYEKVV